VYQNDINAQAKSRVQYANKKKLDEACPRAHSKGPAARSGRKPTAIMFPTFSDILMRLSPRKVNARTRSLLILGLAGMSRAQ